MRRLVVTGDDFGLSADVNRAICEAHDRGILTSASLMVGAPAAKEAVAMARARPGLAVGLHLAVVDGRPSLPRQEVPRLIDADGRLRSSPWRAGLLYRFSSPARRELRREIRRQLEQFRETGLTLSHVDGHHHMHLHPFVLGTLIELAPEFGVRWIRVPAEELGLALAAERGGAGAKIFWSAVFGALRRSARRRLAAAGIGFADRVYGLLLTGRIREEYLTDLIPRIDGGLTELYCHPGAAPGGPAADRELAALVSERVRASVARHGLHLSHFAGEVPAPAPRTASEATR